MRELQVELGERSYPILIGEGLLGQGDLLRPYIHGKQVMVVSNETVAPLYLEKLTSSLSGLQVDSVILPDGEKYKTLDYLNQIFDALLAKRHSRSTTLIALGGGVVGDMTGFAAASYQRGVAFIQMPTTLLAQVDSSVGGKTGVNHARGKNMIGAFHQPNAVLVDLETLNTLPPRELTAGMAEVIKYGAIQDIEFLEWLEAHADALMARDFDALAEAIERSCRCKARIVAADEREGGIRAILNLGHTFGHAIETFTQYTSWLHGEAVGTGMVMAADLSRRLGRISEADQQRLTRLIGACGLPLKPPSDMTAADFMRLMAVDKKVLDGQLRLVLLRSLGDADVTADFELGKLEESLRHMTQDAAG